MAALRLKGIVPGKIFRKSQLLSKTGNFMSRNMSKDQTDHDKTLKKMLELKKQLKEARSAGKTNSNIESTTFEVAQLR